MLTQVDARNVPPQQIALRIIAREGPNVENGFQRGLVDVSIVAQASPRIADDDWLVGSDRRRA